MSLGKCPECGGLWSSDSNTCPHCGHRRECGPCRYRDFNESDFEYYCTLGFEPYFCSHYEDDYDC